MGVVKVFIDQLAVWDLEQRGLVSDGIMVCKSMF